MKRPLDTLVGICTRTQRNDSLVEARITLWPLLLELISEL